MPFAERVADFVEQRRKRAIASMAKIDAERIEAIAEDPRHAQELDGAAVQRDAGSEKMAFDLRAQRLLRLLAVIGVVKAHGIETAARKQPQLATSPPAAPRRGQAIAPEDKG